MALYRQSLKESWEPLTEILWDRKNLERMKPYELGISINECCLLTYSTTHAYRSDTDWLS